MTHLPPRSSVASRPETLASEAPSWSRGVQDDGVETRRQEDAMADRLAAMRTVALLEWENGKLGRLNATLTERLRAVESSTSWRITAPLRQFLQRKSALTRAARRAAKHPPGEPPPAVRAVAPEEILLPDPGERPLVSILIPTFGKVDYTLQCVASIAANRPEAAIEVIVVDDASQDISVPLLARVKHLRLIVNEANLGFLRTCNETAKAARGEFLLLLNNDTQVLPGFLDTMLAVFRDRPDAGAVGSKLIYPDGRLQEAGGMIHADASGRNYGWGDNPDRPVYNFLREVDYCSGASLLIRTQIFAALGGFDERYVPAYYEDTDIAFRLRERGLAVYYQPLSVVIHHEGVSHGRDVTKGVKAALLVNQTHFRARWADALDAEHAPPGVVTVRARDRAAHRSIVLIIDHGVPEPDRDAGSRNMIAFIHALLQARVVVKFYPQDQQFRPHYTQALQRLGVEVIYGTEPDLLRNWLCEHGRALDVVMLSRPTVAEHVLHDLKRHTDARLVYYGVDLHFARIGRQAEVMGSASLRREAVEMERMERWIWRSVDAVLHPSEEEAATVASLEPSVISRAVVPYCFRNFAPVRDPADGARLLFVAGFGHPPNEDAALWFARAVLPLIAARIPAVHLDIVGSHPTAAVKALAGERVRVSADVSDAQLAAFYRRARVAVVPLRFGAGVKLKAVEALSNGVPLVTTPTGAQGLPGLEEICAITADPRQMAEAICRLVEDDAAWLGAATQQVTYARAHFSEEALRASLLRGLGLAAAPVKALDRPVAIAAERAQRESVLV